ncbi:MAG: hypothetical protein GWO41_01930 [candidate division Zixibacteria bacterium]|nr:hypothetical protein [candidate division Zixibacteria bacterium]NIR63870.1 hypothetical protein [candidate division Zixibacteria bacterium]NIS15021.1 hypothetical protein [candidate division Zixibacteria bacterium]NIS45819.1 hypothetical protein [candidate division Zixibacteria bacterium]NIT51527.1 hypothetical protein [candidate division Zixibacteria bacterium]
MTTKIKSVTMFFIAILAAFISNLSAQDPGNPDTLRISDAVGQIDGESSYPYCVEVSVYNDQVLKSLVIPILVDGNYGWTIFDSVSYQGGRLSDASVLDSREKYSFGSDSILQDSLILKFETDTGNLLPAGDGKICEVWFRPVYGGQIDIDSLPASPYGSLRFTTDSDIEFTPQFRPGSIEIPCSYLVGDLRADEHVNSSDLLGINKAYLGCFGTDLGDPWHADVNCDHLTDIRDAFALNDYVFHYDSAGLCECGTYNPAYYSDPGIPDTVWIESDTLYVGHLDTIDVGIVNDEVLRGFAFAIEWDGSAIFDCPTDYNFHWGGQRLIDILGDFWSITLNSYECNHCYYDYINPDTMHVATWPWSGFPLDTLFTLPPGSGVVYHMAFLPATPGEVSMRLVNWNVYSYDYALTRGGESLLITGDLAGIVPVLVGGNLTVLPYMCGDANDDLAVNTSDAVHIINYIFVGGNPPNPMEAGDANCDGSVSVSDAVWVINYVFIGGYSPCDQNNDGIPDC